MTWATALRLGRVSNLPTVWTNAVAAAVLAGVVAPSARLGAVLLSLSLFYVGGMYLNDAFDADIDASERPERPIPSGQVSASLVFAAGYSMLAAATLTLALASSPSTRTATAAAAVALVVAIVCYNARHKANALAPVVMASCRVLVYLAAASALGASLVEMLASAQLWLAAGGLGCYVAGLSYVAAGEHSGMVTRHRPQVLLAIALLCATLLASSNASALGWLAILIAWVVYCLALLLRRDHPDVGAAVVRLIAGISLLDATIVAAMGQPYLAMVVAAAVPATRLLQSRIPAT